MDPAVEFGDLTVIHPDQVPQRLEPDLVGVTEAGVVQELELDRAPQVSQLGKYVVLRATALPHSQRVRVGGPCRRVGSPSKSKPVCPNTVWCVSNLKILVRIGT